MTKLTLGAQKKGWESGTGNKFVARGGTEALVKVEATNSGRFIKVFSHGVSKFPRVELNYVLLVFLICSQV